MGVTRRSFLKIAGLSSLVGLGSGSIVELLDRSRAQAAQTRVEVPEGALRAKRWAMAIFIKKCLEHEHCNECISACHYVHNVPNIPNKKHEVKWIWKEEYKHAFPDQEHEFNEELFKELPFLLLCNHCEHPPCVRVCPTKATFQRPDGIVAMDYHRCIGCRFCMAACPYGSRSFNWEDPRPYIKNPYLEFPTRMKGVVEKCNFCVERLARGLRPACVEACKAGALVFGDLADPDSEVSVALRENFSIRRKPELGTGPCVFYIV
ncbi:4Fe-4S dicluster domain-containing protein [Thermosulfuriphilus ammonigenes]|uniref:4Fe-4S dicluster domain-containing protein n=1 Tax=Thermosulfuriphilus ammonigenes TaxID=1936021 RepID=A0A6G7PT05_9BACT|nr:4Fe-4S dicluster domain-containing protein [Thermosulfuriphilus ammonigenes]MBA2849131.1 molybdopterin-containing oxidoreductase family iron-sulfur binding subunit [Thermosulfuriphilus ammonigenes]QIJ70750.1 4Fe-4S dicluster domain-containing protein [Thermosulfuriphilus ammonigenes]